ncbi:polyprenyl synthetase family protein [Alkalibacillus haloalkaliphilus]|uniref:polyprenyl synthetase family protein n=1 Tax=Alkalibacillus haloalkaliphilus TaxID=94136 RepID=UPI0029358E0B|nr:polyprenyl synthetase family protein [Alkalibacillus haloalkaliphilus]MDV2580829.1 polyprenyl synthetase family protein [Alkalibacillus haloalkaliphilus]
MKLATTIKYMNDDINEIENKMKQITGKEHSMISTASNHLLQAGGKRIRPIFVLLSSQFGQSDTKQAINVAVALELIHMASLVHDDVIDFADTRRGHPTVNYKWDNLTAMYTGDFLFARTLELVKGQNEQQIHDVLSDTIHQVCIGEIEQLRDKYDIDQSLFNYFRRIKRKTALLIATSTRLGAIAANSEPEVVERLGLYGYYIGMSYQIIDDILDFTSNEKDLGKPVGSDLLNGNLTLPTILAFNDKTIYNHVEQFFNNPKDITKAELAIEQIRESNAIEESFQYSQTYLRKALQQLDDLPNTKPKRTLQKIAGYLGKRKF